MSASFASGTAPLPSAESPALPDHGPRLLLSPPPPEPSTSASDDPAPELVRLTAVADSLLADPADGAGPVAADVRHRLAAVGVLLRDAAQAVAAADADVEAARAAAARIRAGAEEAVARLWRTVSADVATRRAATDTFVTRARAGAEREADAIVADASARADLILARAEDLVAAWLDEANAEVARILAAAPAGADAEVRALSAVEPPRRRRRGLKAWLLRRS